MKTNKDNIDNTIYCCFDDDETKSLRLMLKMVKSSANRLTDDLNRYSLDFKRFTIKDLAAYTTMVNTIITASMHLAELLSEAEYRTAFEHNKEKEELCLSAH